MRLDGRSDLGALGDPGAVVLRRRPARHQEAERACCTGSGSFDSPACSALSNRDISWVADAREERNGRLDPTRRFRDDPGDGSVGVRVVQPELFGHEELDRIGVFAALLGHDGFVTTLRLGRRTLCVAPRTMWRTRWRPC